MAEAGTEASQFISGVDYEAFLSNPLLQRGLERDLEIIGEAARRVSEGFREAHPEIPWRDIIGQRNILSHDYGNVIPARVWQTVTEDLTDLLVSLRNLLGIDE
jgi:uncharacterized protein with HEPN domain